MQTNEKKSGYCITHEDKKTHAISFLNVTENYDWALSDEMRKASIFNTEAEALDTFEELGLDVHLFTIMQIEYEFSGKVF